MTEALMWLAGTGVVFTALVLLYSVEDVKGDRVLLRNVRNFLDKSFGSLWTAFDHYVLSSVKVAIHLLFYKIAQNLLQRIFILIQKIEAKAESMIRQHRNLMKHSMDSRERNHLDDIADHKEESALTEKQVEKLRSHE